MSFKSKILYFLKKRIALLNRKKYVKNHYDSYSGTNISIISCNCIGGLIYHDLKEKFRSPTVNLYIESPDFIKFCSNLEHYLSIDKMYFKNNTSYPIGILDDIKIHFLFLE